MSKYIFITGGVCSSLGKGITAASLGCILESRGISVAMQKIDPYINIDPGTMSPYQHGEVYVTEDGTETDLDLGNYERFTATKVSKINSVTTGQIYKAVIERERSGGYSGRTVQVIPHITNEIKDRIHQVANVSKADVVIVEIGGTVGDIESIPFLEAIRQFPSDVGRQNTLYIHVTLIPVLGASGGEAKTKPTQHSVKELREIGIFPDILVCRTSKKLSEEMKQKLSLFCNVSSDAVIEAIDVKSTIYEVPINYNKQGLDDITISKLGIKCDKEADLENWKKIINILSCKEPDVKVGVIGKYINLQDAYNSLYEAIIHGGVANGIRPEIVRIDSEEITKENVESYLSGLNGVIIPGGFGERGISGKINALEYTRTHNIPTFGICLGLHCICIEFARNICNLHEANSTEFNENTKDPIISMLNEQKNLKFTGGTMRRGNYPAHIFENTKTYQIYNTSLIKERHRHRYEFNNDYREICNNNGLIISGIQPERDLAEIMEYQHHPWYIGVQFHPEFNSRPIYPHPLFTSFIDACIKNLNESKLGE